MTGVSPATAVAVALVQRLIDRGLRDAVVCPGSRSQAVALVLAEAESRGLVRLHVRIDERSAGFLALGLARATRRPVAIAVTSGSAVANLWPAVLEAHHDAVPLLLLTADRPEELQGVGANQTTRQRGLFGFAAPWRDLPTATDGGSEERLRASATADEVWDLAAGAGRRLAGPVQLDLPFREPLSGGEMTLRPAPATKMAGGVGAAERQAGSASVRLEATAGTVLVAGTGCDGEEVAGLAARSGLPLFAEVVSGARRGEAALRRPGALLDTDAIESIDRVIVYGRPTLRRQVTRLLADPARRVIVADPSHPEPFRPRPGVETASSVEIVGRASPSWRDWWRRREESLPPDHGSLRSRAISAVWDRASDDDPVYFAASSLVRVADEVLPPRTVRVFSNRGLAGIDGTLSTAVGVALGSTGTTRAVVGDLAFLHDAGGLFRGAGEPQPRLQIVVLNDHGGGIFRGLEVAAADPLLFRRVMETPQHVAMGALVHAYGWRYEEAESVGRLIELLDSREPMVIEVAAEA